MRARPAGYVSLNRALSKLGIASRSDATRLVSEGRVSIDGRVVRDPSMAVVPERIVVAIDGRQAAAAGWLTLVLHKPRGVVTSARDPEGRPTVFDLVAGAGARLVAVGRLDLATSGLLVLTTDSRLAGWLTDPANAVPRVYLVSVRGEVGSDACARLVEGLFLQGQRLAADDVTVRKRSGRETHLVVRLTEGRNREIRRLLDAVGHEVTRLKRVAFGGLQLGSLAPGRWRAVEREELREAFPRAPIGP